MGFLFIYYTTDDTQVRDDDDDDDGGDVVLRDAFVDENPLSAIDPSSFVETRPKGWPCVLYVGVKYTKII